MGTKNGPECLPDYVQSSARDDGLLESTTSRVRGLPARDGPKAAQSPRGQDARVPNLNFERIQVSQKPDPGHPLERTLKPGSTWSFRPLQRYLLQAFGKLGTNRFYGVVIFWPSPFKLFDKASVRKRIPYQCVRDLDERVLFDVLQIPVGRNVLERLYASFESFWIENRSTIITRFLMASLPAMNVSNLIALCVSVELTNAIEAHADQVTPGNDRVLHKPLRSPFKLPGQQGRFALDCRTHRGVNRPEDTWRRQLLPKVRSRGDTCIDRNDRNTILTLFVLLEILSVDTKVLSERCKQLQQWRYAQIVGYATIQHVDILQVFVQIVWDLFANPPGRELIVRMQGVRSPLVIVQFADRLCRVLQGCLPSFELFLPCGLLLQRLLISCLRFNEFALTFTAFFQRTAARILQFRYSLGCAAISEQSRVFLVLRLDPFAQPGLGFNFQRAKFLRNLHLKLFPHTAESSFALIHSPNRVSDSIFNGPSFSAIST